MAAKKAAAKPAKKAAPAKRAAAKKATPAKKAAAKKAAAPEVAPEVEETVVGPTTRPESYTNHALGSVTTSALNPAFYPQPE